MANDVKTYVIFTPHEELRDKFEELKKFIFEKYNDQVENDQDVFHRTYFEPESIYEDENEIAFQLSSAWNCPYDDLICLAQEYLSNVYIVFADEFYDTFEDRKHMYNDIEYLDEEFPFTFIGMNGATIGKVIKDEFVDDEEDRYYVAFESYIPRDKYEYMLYYLAAWDVSTNDTDYSDYLDKFDFITVDGYDEDFYAYDSDLTGFFDWLEKEGK